MTFVKASYIMIRAISFLLCLSTAFANTSHAQTNYQGVTYYPSSPHAFETTSSVRSLQNIKRVGADSVAIIDTWFQDSPTTTSIERDTDQWSLTEVGLENMIDEAQTAGLRIMLKPHVDVRSGEWRAYIDPPDVDAWFDSYGTFMNQYAELAQRKNIDTLVIGTELNSMERHRDQWQQLISGVRDRYDGELGYAANWNDGGVTGSGYETVPWWSDVDYIGIDAYFPVGTRDDFSLPRLTQDWEQLADNLSQWRTNAGFTQPVVFTEFGYGSHREGHLRPWDNGTEPNMDVQTNAYQAMLQVMGKQPWWGGGFLWSWEANPNLGGTNDATLAVQNKPTETVLATNYDGQPTFLYHPWELTSWESNFEGRLSGWADKFDAASGRFDDELSQSTTGVTDGEFSLAITSSDPGDHLAARVFWSRWSGHEAYTTIRQALKNPENFDLQLDVTYRDDETPDEFDFMQVNIAAFSCGDANCEDGSWVQSAPLAVVNSQSPLDSTQTVSVPFAQFGELHQDREWYEFHIGHTNDWQSEGTYYVDRLRLVSNVTGDVNNDGLVSALDMDVLGQAVTESRYVEQFDLTGDGTINEADRDAWLQISNTLVGDADQNGRVEFADFLVLSDSFGMLGGWASGDFSGNGRIGFPDFLLLSANFGEVAETRAVPEPTTSWLGLLTLAMTCRRTRKRKRNYFFETSNVTSLGPSFVTVNSNPDESCD